MLMALPMALSCLLGLRCPIWVSFSSIFLIPYFISKLFSFESLFLKYLIIYFLFILYFLFYNTPPASP